MLQRHSDPDGCSAQDQVHGTFRGGGVNFEAALSVVVIIVIGMIDAI